MFTDTYYVDREAGTYSDACTAFGLAYILERVLIHAGQTARVTIQDGGTCYVINLGVILNEQMLGRATYPDELLPFLQDQKHPEGAKHYSLTDYFRILQSRSKEVSEKAELESIPREVPPDLGIYQIIRLQQGDGLMNMTAHNLWNTTRGRNAYSELLRVILEIYSVTPNTLEKGKKTFTKWKKTFGAEDFSNDATFLAIFNPSQQKSINRAKADSAEGSNSKGFWLPE